MDKKTNIIYLKSQIFLFFAEALTLTNLLKRREIFAVLNKLYVFFCPYISSQPFKFGIILSNCFSVFLYDLFLCSVSFLLFLYCLITIQLLKIIFC